MRPQPTEFTLQVCEPYWHDLSDKGQLVTTTSYLKAGILQDRYARENPGTRYRIMSDVGLVGVTMCYPAVKPEMAS